MMDRNQFDTITRSMTTQSSRRQIFAGVLGGAAALLAGTTVARPAKKGGGSLKSKPTKTPICHFDEETGLFTFVQVLLKPGKGHDKHTLDVFTDPDTGELVTREYCESLNVPDPGLG